MKKIRGYYFYKHFTFLYKLYALYIKHNSFIPKKSQSIFGEDVFADKYFKKLNKGFYVDVGAYHPFFWSNTYLLFKRKWEGINIDINHLSVELFNIARSNDHNVNASVSNSNKKVKKYYTKNMFCIFFSVHDILTKHFNHLWSPFNSTKTIPRITPKGPWVAKMGFEDCLVLTFKTKST